MEGTNIHARRRYAIGIMQIIMAFALAGSSVVAGKCLVGTVPPNTASLLALACGLVFLAPSLVKRIPSIKGARRRDILIVCVQGLFGMALFRFFMLKGLASTSAVHAGIISSLGPAVMGAASAIVLRERAKPLLWIGLVLGTAGVVLLRAPGADAGASSFGGDLLVLMAVICEAAMSVIKKKFGDPLDPLATASVIVITSLICTLPLAVGEWIGGGFPAIGPREWLAVLYYGAFATALAYWFWAAGSSKVGGSTIALAMVAMPVSSVILSAAILGERPGIPALMGLALGVAGIIVGQAGGGSAASARPCGEESAEGIMRHGR